MSEGNKGPQFIAAICICIGAMGTGTVIAWTSNISDKLEDGELNDVNVKNFGIIGSMMCLGATCVCIPVGIMADVLGRKLTILSTIIPFLLGWVLIILAQNEIMIVIGRFLTGMAGGSFCILAPLYTSEIAQTEIRGTLGTFLQLFITIGILYANIFGWKVSVKGFCIMCAAIPIVFGCLFVLQPETPVYLVKTGRKEQALVVYEKLRGKEYDPTPEIEAIQTQMAKEEEMKEQFMTTLKSKPGWKSSLICFMLMFYQQLSGINAVMFYSGKIFEDAGSTIESSICAVIIGAVQVLATIIASVSIDKLGRKLLLIISCFIMSISTFLLGVFFLMKDKEMVSKDTIKSLGFLPLLSLVLFIIAFSFGLGPIPWIASSEIFPPPIMARMSSYAGMFNWFLGFCVTVGYEPISKAVGSYTTFFVFSIVLASGVFFVLFIIPETKGKTFQEIQDELAS